MIIILYILFSLLFAVSAFASEPPVGVITHLDSPSFKDRPVFCEEDPLEPIKNDFEILNYNVMISEEGHRYAILTIRNASAGQRLLTDQHLVAIYADCNSDYPMGLKQKLSGGQITTRTVYFGRYKFPIIKVISKKEI